MKNAVSKSITALVLGLLSLFSGCEKNPDKDLPGDPVQITLNSTQTSLIESGNSFSFDIFRKVVQNSSPAENVIISPLSISYALSMTLNGANGATRDSILKTLRVNGITPDQINASLHDLTDALLSVDQRVKMNIANSVWIEKNFTVKTSFTDILNSYYDAEARSFDILDATVPDKINSWIKDKTDGLIKNMIERLNDNTVMLLINAIYFKGKWKSEFDPDNTIQRDFIKTGGSSTTVQMMRQKADFKIYEGNGFVLGEFPYGQGNFVMDIILPSAEDGVSAVLPSVTATSFASWTSRMSVRETNLLMPRFKYDFKIKLKDILSAMGMKITFYEGADFTNIASYPPLLINEVTHQAFIETNEEGTEAAAATVVDIGLTSLGPPQPFTFNVNHSFIYIIRETTTGSVIFMGKVADPSAE